MRLADPSDLLRTILNDSSAASPADVVACYQQAMVFTGCTVHIHQHGAGPIAPEPAAQPAAA